MPKETPEELYISVDVETAGPVPATYSMLSLGACVVSAPTQSFYVELRPINENTVPEALAISGFSLTELAERGEEPVAAMAGLRDWIAEVAKERVPIFVGFNAAFDWSFVNWYFHEYLKENPFGFAPVDIKAFYMGLAGCLWSETKSSKLPLEFRAAEQTKEHHALADARAQAEIFSRLLTTARSQRREWTR